MVPVERIELPTFGLQNRCTTAVLHRLSASNDCRHWLITGARGDINRVWAHLVKAQISAQSVPFPFWFS